MSGTIIVTGGDSRYFPLMREMILSIRTKPEGASLPIGVSRTAWVEPLEVMVLPAI